MSIAAENFYGIGQEHGDPCNLYAMIHGRTKEDCERIASEISAKTGIRDYKLLYSTREFKKTSMEYF